MGVLFFHGWRSEKLREELLKFEEKSEVVMMYIYGCWKQNLLYEIECGGKQRRVCVCGGMMSCVYEGFFVWSVDNDI